MAETVHPAEIADRVYASFRESLPGSDPTLCFAPGRINLLGAHLDYNGGVVLPVTVHLGVYVAAQLRRDGRITARSLNHETVIDIDIAEIDSRPASSFGWGAYPIGVWSYFAAATGCDDGIDLVFGGDLPMAAGLSSSAAIELATACALDELHRSNLPPAELADIAHQAETGFVGLSCGIMDQYASALGREGQALLLNCQDASTEYVPIDSAKVEFLVMDSRKRRSLGETCFNQRVEECRRALEILSRAYGHRPALADYTLDEVKAASEALGEISTKRARHVVTEMARVITGVACLRRDDLQGFGDAVSASHRSTAIDYEVSCAELDELVASANARDEVFGARLTGAGFGGCAIALVAAGHTETVISSVEKSYRQRFGSSPNFHVLKAGKGLRCLRSAQR